MGPVAHLLALYWVCGERGASRTCSAQPATRFNVLTFWTLGDSLWRIGSRP